MAATAAHKTRKQQLKAAANAYKQRTRSKTTSDAWPLAGSSGNTKMQYTGNTIAIQKQYKKQIEQYTVLSLLQQTTLTCLRAKN
jgi:hypothetical protein